jgi:hypothetical protein
VLESRKAESPPPAFLMRQSYFVQRNRILWWSLLARTGRTDSRKLGQACTHIGVQLLLAVDELRSVKPWWMGAKNHQLMPYWITRSISAIDLEVDDRLIDAAGRRPQCRKSSAVR